MNSPSSDPANPNGPPQLFDVPLRRARRDAASGRRLAAGARRPGLADAAYLRAEAAQACAERLRMINRRFRRAAVFGAAHGEMGDALRAHGVETVLEFDDAPAAAAALAAHRNNPVHRTQISGWEADGAEADIVAVGGLDPSPLPPASVDLLVSVLELHAANDPVAALAQARLALQPDGLFLGVMVGGETLHELRHALAAAEIETAGGLSPRIAPMAELRDLGGLLQRAGFALPVADSDRLTVWFDNVLTLMQDLRAMGETNVLSARHQGFLRRDTVAALQSLYAERHARADGRIPATVDLITLTAWAPAASQQKPLRPGSAAARLADALGTEEHRAGEAPNAGNRSY